MVHLLDIWALMNEKDEADMVIFKKVESLFQNVQYRPNTVELLVQVSGMGSISLSPPNFLYYFSGQGRWRRFSSGA